MRDIQDAPMILEVGDHINPVEKGLGCIMEMVSWLNGDEVVTDKPNCVEEQVAMFMWNINDKGLLKYGIPARGGDGSPRSYRAADAHQVAELTRLGLKVMGKSGPYTVSDGIKLYHHISATARTIVKTSKTFDEMIALADRYLDNILIDYSPHGEEVREPRSGQLEGEKV
ncbi:hypothetical protein BJD55_gp123 [Gordonia phage Yvonnetastic]|uniref:Uncharacterized protein n=1 Tax=Gordonia phage Yvonnetastic TaxID=1821566 RepID=A0A142K960_9CAUD|nr:hypothetical protein BJD55_gp123 [Gordonia phage Yvonnetastic]AMS02643.1 hypothetical protein SEA_YVONNETASTIC_99 [Gordonia phage Yvonnetastic]